MSYRSFIDVLFILLLAAIVMLAQSFHVGGLEMEPAKVGADGVSSLHADEVQLVVVTEDALLLEEREYADGVAVDRALAPGQPVLLVAQQAVVSHQRVMTAWSELKNLGRDVRLGVEPTDPADDSPQEPATTSEGA